MPRARTSQIFLQFPAGCALHKTGFPGYNQLYFFPKGTLMMKKWLAVLFLLLLFPPAAHGESEIVPQRAAYALGEAVRLTVASDRTVKGCKYAVFLDGNELFRQKSSDSHTDVWYLPRKPGAYRIDVSVTCQDKKKENASCEFLVTEVPAAVPEGALYSQKDGSWADDKYGKEHLEKSRLRDLHPEQCPAFPGPHRGGNRAGGPGLPLRLLPDRGRHQQRPADPPGGEGL